MKKIGLLICLFIGVIAFSQSDNKWAFGATFTPQTPVSSSTIEQGHYMGYYTSTWKLNSSFGIQAQRNIGNSFQLLAGLNYSVNDITGTFYCHVCDFFGPIEPEKLKVRFAEVPLAVRYKRDYGNWSIYGQLGFSAGYLLEISEHLNRDFVINGLYEPEISRVGKINVDSRVGAGIGYSVSEFMQLQFTGVYKHSLLSIPNYRFNSIGIEIGVLFKI